MGLRLLVPPKTFCDCGYSSHRRPFGTAVTRPTEDLLGLRLLVPPKTFWDVIDTSTSCASKAQREPVESVRLAWRSRCHLQIPTFSFIPHLPKYKNSVSEYFIFTHQRYILYNH